MALIKCRKCGSQISDRAAVCVKCGYTIGSAPQISNNIKQTEFVEEVYNMYDTYEKTASHKEHFSAFNLKKTAIILIPTIIAVVAIAILIPKIFTPAFNNEMISESDYIEANNKMHDNTNDDILNIFDTVVTDRSQNITDNFSTPNAQQPTPQQERQSSSTQTNKNKPSLPIGTYRISSPVDFRDLSFGEHRLFHSQSYIKVVDHETLILYESEYKHEHGTNPARETHYRYRLQDDIQEISERTEKPRKREVLFDIWCEVNIFQEIRLYEIYDVDGEEAFAINSWNDYLYETMNYLPELNSIASGRVCYALNHNPNAPKNVGDIIVFGSYDVFDGKLWQILDIQGNDALIIMFDGGIGIDDYHSYRGEITWESSTLRSYLNGDFYNSYFGETNKTKIIETINKNSSNLQYDTNGGNDTVDKIFLLSIDEVNKYANILFNEDSRSWEWWLRSPGIDYNYAAFVNYNSNIDFQGFPTYCNVSIGQIDVRKGVRPAMWITLN